MRFQDIYEVLKNITFAEMFVSVNGTRMELLISVPEKNSRRYENLKEASK